MIFPIYTNNWEGDSSNVHYENGLLKANIYKSNDKLEVLESWKIHISG